MTAPARVATRVLVIKLSALGDVILAMAAFARIRAAHPDAHITLLTTPSYEALMRASPWFDAVETDGRPRTLAGFLRLIGRLRRARHGRVYDLQANDRTNLYFQALRPFPPLWSGTAFGCALPHRTPARMRMHTLEREADQLRAAGIWPDAPVAPGAAPGPDVSWLMGPYPKPAESDVPLALLVPGASPKRPLKRWPTSAYGHLATALIASGYEVVIIGGETERDLGREIARHPQGIKDLTGQTDFGEIARLGARAHLAVGNDTGPLHLIAAAGAPTLALFSSESDPDLCAPRGRVSILRESTLKDLDPAVVLDKALAISSWPGSRMS
jgi:ADP-heptose:LPS heptosyltransferase